MAPRPTRRDLLLASGATLTGLAGCVSSGLPAQSTTKTERATTARPTPSPCRYTVQQPANQQFVDVTDAASEGNDELVNRFVESVAVVRDDGWAVVRIGLTEGGVSALDRLVIQDTASIPIGEARVYEHSLGRVPYHGRFVVVPSGATGVSAFDLQVVVDFNCAG